MSAPSDAEDSLPIAGPDATFVHEPLDRSLKQIRLVSIIPEAEGPIRCNIKHVELSADKTPDYRALSYVWGPPSDVQRIRVNGKDFVVRQNLHQFLQAFRARLFTFRGCGAYEDEVQWLWIDQICIDQSIVKERNHQVQMMSDIYKRATYVYVWLGRSDSCTEAVMRALKSNFRQHLNERCSAKKTRSTALSRKQELEKNLAQEDRDETKPLSSIVLKYFFENPYWHRLWVVQEIMLARYIRIICGETLLSWEELQRFCSTGLRQLPTDSAQAVPPQVIWLAEHALSAKTYSYPSLLLTFSLNGCHDPRDKVFGFQGLVKPGERMEIDYEKPVVEVFGDAVTTMVRGGSHIPPTKYGKGFEGLDFKKPLKEIFQDAAAIMTKRAEDTINLRLVETLVLLGDQMGLKLSKLRSATEKEQVLGEIRTLWRLLPHLCSVKSRDAELSTNIDSSSQFQSVVAQLHNRYNALTTILRKLLFEILRINRNEYNTRKFLYEVQTQHISIRKDLMCHSAHPFAVDPRYYDTVDEWSILPHYDDDVPQHFRSVVRSMQEKSKHIEQAGWFLDLTVSNFRFINHCTDKVSTNAAIGSTTLEFELQRTPSQETSLWPRTRELSMRVRLRNGRIHVKRIESIFREFTPEAASLMLTLTFEDTGVITPNSRLSVDFNFDFDLNRRLETRPHGTYMWLSKDEADDKQTMTVPMPSSTLFRDVHLRAIASGNLGEQETKRVRDGELRNWKCSVQLLEGIEGGGT